MLSFGSDHARRAGLAFGDALACRVSAEWADKDSAVRYPSMTACASYDDLTSAEYYTIRGKLLWLPGGAGDTRVLFSYAHSYDSPAPNMIAGPDWGTDFGLPPGFGPSYDDARGDTWIGLSPVGLPVHAFMENRDTTVDSLGAEVTHDLSESLRFTAMTGLSRSVTGRAPVNHGMPYDFPGLGFDTFTEGEFVQRTLLQEFRLNYDGKGLKWVAGLYAGRTNNDAWRRGRLPGIDPMAGICRYDQETRNSLDITNIALFGETTWEFSPGLSLIAGGRLDWFRQSQTGTTDNDYFMYLPPDAVFPADPDTAYTDLVFLPELGLEYATAPNQSLALAWRGSFLDDRLSLAAHIFWQEWKNQQVEVDPVNAYIANAVKSESRGAAIELAWAASDALNLFASVGLLHTGFRDFNLADYGNFDGKPFPNGAAAFGRHRLPLDRRNRLVHRRLGPLHRIGAPGHRTGCARSGEADPLYPGRCGIRL